MVKSLILVALAVTGIAFGALGWRVTRSTGAIAAALRSPLGLGIGFVTNFFDTLGIGSYAPTTAMFRLSKYVPDRVIPGTLNAGHTPPTVVQALIYIAVVDVAMSTLVPMLAAAVLGAWVGADRVARWPQRAILAGMGCALLVAAALFAAANLDAFPLGGAARGLSGAMLLLAITGNFVLGVLMTLGIGLYAPCMIMVSLLGMDPRVAFPIMMGSCAFLMPTAGLRFLRHGAVHLEGAVALALGGIPAVLLAAYIVKSLPLVAVRWLVVVVVTYTAVTLLAAATRPRVSGDTPA
jgi:uncharacterized membrane protein YfcA